MEILTVLIATTEDNQRQANRQECLALLRGALAIRLRPRIARSDWARLAALKLMYLGAAVELLVGITVMATMTNMRSRVVATNPAYSSGQWHAEVTSTLRPLVVSAVIATAFWLWMAWANGRRQRWAPIAFVFFFAITTYSLLNGLVNGSATYARADLAAGSVLWLVQLSVVILLFHNSGRTVSRLRSRRTRIAQRGVPGT